MNVEYEFCDVVDDWVLLRCEYECKIRNISSKKERYELVYEIERPLGPQPPEFEKQGVFRLELGKSIPRDIDLTERQRIIEQADLKVEDTEIFKRYSDSCEVEAGEEIDVYIGAYVPKRLVDSELWRSALTSDGLTVKVRYDPKKIDLGSGLIKSTI